MVPTRSPLVTRFCSNALPADEWTHEAHLRVAYDLLAEVGGAACVVALLRTLIPAHNARVGVPAGHGYHETITRYYVAAVAALADRPFEQVVMHRTCAPPCGTGRPSSWPRRRPEVDGWTPIGNRCRPTGRPATRHPAPRRAEPSDLRTGLPAHPCRTPAPAAWPTRPRGVVRSTEVRR
jgi:hypothetical protein